MRGALTRGAINNYRLNGPGGSNVKSVQRGSYTISSANNDITISSVNTDNSIVTVNFWVQTGSADYSNIWIKASLLNSTTVRLTVASYNALYTVIANWEVVEFNNVKSLQTGSRLIASANDTVSITGVNREKSSLIYSYTTGPDSVVLYASLPLFGELTDSATITFKHQFASAVKTAEWQVIEFT